MTQEETDTKTIAIVDDHRLFSSSLEKLINSFSGFEVVLKALNGKDLQHQLSKNEGVPDIILLDINMPVMNGCETAKWLKNNHPDSKVMALSMNDEEETVLEMFRQGAKGYLLKDIHPDQLKRALNDLVEKGFYHTERVNDIMVNSLQDKEGSKPNNTLNLKDNEIEFMKLACTEMTYNEIAEVMMLSPKTIDNYRQNLFQKLNVKNRVGLAMYAIKNKFVEF